MNQPSQALESQKIFNQMMIDELGDQSPGTDMRLAISFNQIGVAYLMNDGKYHLYSSRDVTNSPKNVKRQKTASNVLSKK